MRVVIAAAGTGGHVNPGLAIANRIKLEEKNAEIIFIGTVYGLENDLVPRAGYELKTVSAHGLSLKPTIENVRNLIDTIKGIGQAKKILEKFKPDIVIGTGGYICGPVMLAAKRLKIKTMLHESNAFPGKAVEMLSKKVDTVLIGFEDAKARLPKAKNVVTTGTPTKVKEDKNVDRERICSELKINPNIPIVLVFGGSQGARTINNSLTEMIIQNQIKHYQIVWAAGTKQFDGIKQKLSEHNIKISNLKNERILPYIYNMEEMLNVCDLIISRSGAMTINEVAVVGKPAIFIPLPNVSQNHQEYNARVLEKVGAAKIILDKDLNNIILANTVEELLSNKEKLMEMGQNAKKITIKNVEDKIYNEIKKLVNL